MCMCIIAVERCTITITIFSPRSSLQSTGLFVEMSGAELHATINEQIYTIINFLACMCVCIVREASAHLSCRHHTADNHHEPAEANIVSLKDPRYKTKKIVRCIAASNHRQLEVDHQVPNKPTYCSSYNVTQILKLFE